MRGDRQQLNSKTLPEDVAVFPLSGALLLPHGMLPLNIFEPRYLNLVEDALGQGRMMAMIQPKDSRHETGDDNTPLYSVGCLGRISSFVETDDGHFQIVITGQCRFRVIEELGIFNGYRRLRVDYTPFLKDLAEEDEILADRALLQETLSHYFEHSHIDIDDAGLDEMEDDTLVISMSMVCPFDPREKQALLECSDLIERARLLQTLLEMDSHGDEGSTPPLGIN